MSTLPPFQFVYILTAQNFWIFLEMIILPCLKCIQYKFGWKRGLSKILKILENSWEQIGKILFPNIPWEQSLSSKLNNMFAIVEYK
jgi:hypothetical protein